MTSLTNKKYYSFVNIGLHAFNKIREYSYSTAGQGPLKRVDLTSQTVQLFLEALQAIVTG